jgi:hypothetical protein
MYSNLNKKNDKEHFNAFLDLHDFNNWLMDESNNKYVVCDILIHEQMLYQLHKKCHFIGMFTQATIDDWIINF